MTLWTIQPLKWYEMLLETGIIYSQKRTIEKSFIRSYRWLMEKMDAKVGKRPFDECYPVWAWYQYADSKRRKPDLRSTGFLPKGTKGVRVEINKNDKEVLLSDFILWHYVLNYWEISDNEEESNEFDRLLKMENISFTEKEKYTPMLKQKVEQSWDKIFDMSYSLDYSASPFDKKSIQATFWTLSIDEVVKVDHFTVWR